MKFSTSKASGVQNHAIHPPCRYLLVSSQSNRLAANGRPPMEQSKPCSLHLSLHTRGPKRSYSLRLSPPLGSINHPLAPACWPCSSQAGWAGMLVTLFRGGGLWFEIGISIACPPLPTRDLASSSPSQYLRRAEVLASLW